MQKGKKYNGLDIGKFLCSFLILFYHYFSEYGKLPGILDEFLSLYAVAVALFMCISGYLMFEKIEYIEDTCVKWGIVKKQITRVYTIYLLWSIPYLVFQLSRWDWNSLTVEKVMWNIQHWIFNSTFYTIWFMPMLAIGLLVTFWITEKLKDRIVYILAFICYTSGAFFSTYSFLGKDFIWYNEIKAFIDTWLGGPRGWMFFAFPLIMVGRLMVRVKKKRSIAPKIMLVFSFFFLVLLVGEALALRFLSRSHTGIDLALMILPSSFCILGFLISIEIPNGAYTLWMRRMSTLIFMSQRLFLTVLPQIFPSVFKLIYGNYYIGAINLIVLVLGFSEGCIIVSAKCKMLKRLF